LECTKRITIAIDHFRYYNFTNRASRLGITLEEFVHRYGFGQVRVQSLLHDSKGGGQEHDLLAAIKELSGSLKTTKIKSERKERSRSLALKMKKLYQYKCQLCDHSDDGHSIPLIIMENGRY